MDLYSQYFWLANFSLVDNLAEENFVKFISGEMKKHETMIKVNKKREVKAISEIASLFKSSKTKSCKFLWKTIINENWFFNQFMRSNRKWIYKEMEDSSQWDQENIQSLIWAKEDLERHLSEMAIELNQYNGEYREDDHNQVNDEEGKMNEICAFRSK